MVSTMNRKTLRDIILGGGAAAALLLALPAVAADAAGEIKTAATHASLAADAGALDGVHMHLHHALNCLVGPGGDGFDAKQINPCSGSGNGAIPDESDGAKKKSLEEVAAKLRTGIAESDLAKAQKTARQVGEMLTVVK
jgi:hypothetical protein